MRDEHLERAARIIKNGGLVVYPTETFYGLGVDVLNRNALARVIALKGRPSNKPLPLILGSSDQLALISTVEERADSSGVPAGMAENEFEDFQLLTEYFWPGPLSILTRTKPGLPPEIQDRQGFASVRISGHDVARRLALIVGRPVTATSANLSGRPPAAEPTDLDPVMLQGVDLVLDEKPWPSGDLPSTVARLLGSRRLVVLRWGAVTRGDLAKAGFTIEIG